MIGIQLDPVDSWFFRDGTPFTAGSTPQDSVSSLFPPHPPTLVGALRVALALDHGWNGRGRWPSQLNAVLGNGPEDLGKLSFDGPFLVQDGKPLFRAPHHLLGLREAQGWTPMALLRPGLPVNCDLGEGVELPELPRTDGGSANLKPGHDQWLTQGGMNAVLHGRVPDRGHVVPSRRFWSPEVRTGLERNEHRTAKEGRLYSTWHVRPRTGVSLGARISGLPTDWSPPSSRLVPLGGESRLAECRPWHVEAATKVEAPLDEIAASKRLALVALSPLDVEEEVVLGSRPLEICGIPRLGAVRVVSACLQRPQRIGGWDSLRRRPLPLRSVLPPGSVLFCRLSEPSSAMITSSCGMAHVGSRQAWGFGLVALGIWPSGCEVQR